jgi:hypothetical protein
MLAIIITSLCVLDDGAYSSCLLQPLAFVCVIAKDGEVAFWLQPFVVSSHNLPRSVIKPQWPTR